MPFPFCVFQYDCGNEVPGQVGGDGQDRRLLRWNRPHSCWHVAGCQQLPGSRIYWDVLRFVRMHRVFGHVHLKVNNTDLFLRLPPQRARHLNVTNRAGEGKDGHICASTGHNIQKHSSSPTRFLLILSMPPLFVSKNMTACCMSDQLSPQMSLVLACVFLPSNL